MIDKYSNMTIPSLVLGVVNLLYLFLSYWCLQFHSASQVWLVPFEKLKFMNNPPKFNKPQLMFQCFHH